MSGKIIKRLLFWVLGLFCFAVIWYIIAVGGYYFVFSIRESSSVFQLTRPAYIYLNDGSWWVGVLSGSLIFFDELYDGIALYKRLIFRALFWGLCVAAITQFAPIEYIYAKCFPPAYNVVTAITWKFRLLNFTFYMLTAFFGVLIARKLKWP